MSETVVIVDYGSGNLRSAANAVATAGETAGRNLEVVVTDDPAAISKAGRIILPGVGAFGHCMAGLLAIAGMRASLESAVLDHGVPFLGICVGMQLLATTGLEYGRHDGLGWVDGLVEPIAPDHDRSGHARKIPHMGWNDIELTGPGCTHPVLAGLHARHFYFVHSFAFRPDSADVLLATAEYGPPLAAAIGRDNVIGVQFHPEKSQRAGLALLCNFLQWRP